MHGQMTSWPDPLHICSLIVQGLYVGWHNIEMFHPSLYLEARPVQITAILGGGLLGVSVWGCGTASKACSSAEAQAENTVAWGYERSHKEQNGKTYRLFLYVSHAHMPSNSTVLGSFVPWAGDLSGEAVPFPHPCHQAHCPLQ